MLGFFRFLLAAVACVALAAGCSKPVTPVSGDVGSRETSTFDRHGRDGDRPNRPYLVRLHFVGTVASLDSEFRPRVHERADFFVYSDGAPLTPPDAFRDTVPVDAVLQNVRWRRMRHGASSAAAGDGAEYFDEAPDAMVPDSHGDPSQGFPPGSQTLVLKVPERLGGGRIQVAFVVGFAPEAAWFAGPDPALFPPASDGDGRAVDVTDWARFTTSPAWPPDGRRYFGPDSFQFVPSSRRPVGDDLDRRTFYEIFGDRIYARNEGDAVHLNSWVVFPLGGFDRDSRYVPRIGEPGNTLPAGFAGRPDLYSALIAQGLLASPIGFRHAPIIVQPDGTQLRGAETVTYPVFDVTSVFRNPVLAGYMRNERVGKVYLSIADEDAEHMVGRLREDPVALVERVDSGGGIAEDRVLRRRVLTYRVRPDAATSPGPGAIAGAGSGSGAGRRN